MNAVAPSKMRPIPVTLAVLMTLAVFHPSTGWLNEEPCINMQLIFVTLAVSQREMFSLKSL